jgi:hypothetical protein
VTIRLEVAIFLGTILSLLSYLYRTSKPSLKVMGFDTDAPGRPFVVRADVPAPLGECPQLKMVRMRARSTSARSPTSRSSCTTCARRWPRRSTCS